MKGGLTNDPVRNAWLHKIKQPSNWKPKTKYGLLHTLA